MEGTIWLQILIKKLRKQYSMKQIKNHWHNFKATGRYGISEEKKKLGCDYVKNTIAESDEW